MPQDLSLVPINDLVVELMNRCDHVIFSAMQCNVNQKNDHLIMRKWKGNSATCMGLAQQVSNVIFKRYEETESSPISEIP